MIENVSRIACLFKAALKMAAGVCILRLFGQTLRDMTPFRFALRTAFLLAVVIAGCTRSGRPPDAPQAAAVERDRFREELIDVKIEGTMRGPLNDSTEGAWEGAFWGMGLSRHASAVTEQGLRRAFADLPNRSPGFRRALLEAVYTMYPDAFGEEMLGVLGSADSPKLFAMAALHLARTGGPAGRALVRGRLEARFPAWQSDPILASLHFDLTAREAVLAAGTPPLADLLAHRFGNASAVLFSIQRPNRDMPGLAVVRRPSGGFVREKEGRYFSVPHFARAASNLPGYITNGNTPQGVFSFQGFTEVENPFIGPTETIQLVMPHEVPPAVFFHGTVKDSAWSEDLYARLLPGSWRGWFPLWEAERAGRAGRTEIIAHGTTIDPWFSVGQPWFPNTPSQGCLTAYEEWSVDGVNTRSDQLTLVQVLREAGFDGGWCVVVELPGRDGPVTLAEVEGALTAAEAAAPPGEGAR
jgi:hypothetical protein